MGLAIKEQASVPSSFSFSKIGAALAVACLLVPLCSLPPMRFGYYNQVESCLMAFWGVAAGVCLWLYFLGKRHARLVENTFRLPIVWGPLLLGMATILLSPFHALPLRDFIGSPHIAEGVLTFMASGVIAGHFSILTRIPVYRRIILTTAFIVGLLICALTIIGSMESPFINWRYWQWAPYFFPDFLSFIVIALAALYLCLRKNMKSPYFPDILALTLFTLLTYYASNKSLGYGIFLSVITTLVIWASPLSWKRNLLLLSFFGLSFTLTLLIVFYDGFASWLPEPLKFLGQLSTLTSRTWLSRVTFAGLATDPLNWNWLQQVLVGQGWGTFSNISTANMFLIDQVCIFTGKEYNPSWELVNRDLLHTHNILTNYFHSLGILGLSLYLYIQYKLIKSLPRNALLMGAAFLISYQVQHLFWFQFMVTVPFTLLAFSVLFRKPTSVMWPFLLKKNFLPGISICLFLFSLMQGVVTLGYERNLKGTTQSSVHDLTTASFVRLESHFGAQRQVRLARLFATSLQKELEKSPQELVTHSLKLVHHLSSLPKESNYLASNLAINILSELAANPETLKFLNTQTFMAWEQLVKDHIEVMPHRSDILLPFFNLYQTLGREAIVLEFTRMIHDRNPCDPIALWFMGSSLLKNPSRFDEGLCFLQKAVHGNVERFMPVPPPLKSKVMSHARVCP